jgi:predicted TPR repeat methyltransferase
MRETENKALARVLRARALSNEADLRSLYADWANTYDADVYGELKITGSQRVADLLAAHLKPDANIHVLDAGCGTGAVAACLQTLGFRAVDGIDLSPEMLEVARAKNLYRKLVICDLNQPFSLCASPYIGIVSAGTFTTGHVGATGFENLFAHLDENGVTACAIADAVWQRDGFDALLAGLHVEILFHQIESIVPDIPADTHMLVLTRSLSSASPE